MGQMLQLDAAAKLVGKSEVTLRRLVKAGKVGAKKEKTLTGFIYLVDADDVRKYYRVRNAELETEIRNEMAPQAAEKVIEEKTAVVSNGKVRVAVAEGTGSSVEYWLKRAETYEERYHHEAQKVAGLREEVGLWRGRAENANALLMKMLPSPTSIQINGPAEESVHHLKKKDASSNWLVWVAVLLGALLAGMVLAVGYFLVK